MILAVIAAIALIAIGGYNAWRSFQRFDESVLVEKDSQLYSLVRSDDINIENTISSQKSAGFIPTIIYSGIRKNTKFT